MPTDTNLPPQFQAVLDRNENILWVGTPKLVPFLLTGVPFFALGLCWGAFDYFGFIRHMDAKSGGFMIPFFLLHLFPFWGSILNMLRLALVHKNTFYAFTNKRVLLRTGFWGTDFNAIDFDAIQDLIVTVNPVENMLGVGSIKAFTGTLNSKGARVFNTITAIEQPYEVFRRIKQVGSDFKTDLNYPNALRPPENPGYKTTYEDTSGPAR